MAARSESAHAKTDAGAGLEARRAALEILLRVEHNSAFADVLLGTRLPEFAPADRRLITRLVLGTLAWRGRLDFELARLSSRPLDAIAREILEMLRMGLFQLRFLDRLPAHAVVDTAVTMATRMSRETRGSAGFVNAILRRAARQAAPRPRRSGNKIGYLTVLGSHPRWMAAKFVQWFGTAGAASLMAANNEAAPNAIRLNLARGAPEALIAELDAAGFAIAERGRFPETVILGRAPDFSGAALRSGVFHLQSEASQMVARMLAPAPGADVVDCCAAPGGKATHLAELVGERGRVLALDLNLAGLRRVRTLARRLRHRNVFAVRASLAAAPPAIPGRFDYVLIDAPCTGLGTLREHPEIRWRLRESDLERMAAVQSRMLSNAATLVKPGGALVYAVCSFAPEEGPGVIRDFLAHHREFSTDPSLSDGRLKEFLDDDGFMATRPDRGGLDGFFAARLLRRPRAD